MHKFRKLIFASTLAAGALVAGVAWAACTTIQDGTLKTSDGVTIEPGYDRWGYNYQAQTFNGTYCDAYRNAAWCQPYVDVELLMKWNSAWLGNKDCDGDGLLDRHLGESSYIGSEAWLTNHQSGLVEDGKGRLRTWTYFVKIVAAPANATKFGDFWLAADGTEIGAVIWGQFAVVQEVVNDPSNGAHGVVYLSPWGPGVGSGHLQ